MTDFKTFIDSSDVNKIDAFLNEDFYIFDTMLVMELPDIASSIKKINVDPDILKYIQLYEDTDLSEYLEANGKGFGAPDPEEDVRTQLSNPDSKIYVLRKRGRILSSVTVWKHDEDTLSTENIFTIKSVRERGYAQTVLFHALSLAKERGYKKARLTVYAGDVAAIRMYQKFGYRITKVLQELRHE